MVAPPPKVKSADASITPRTQEEKEAVRQALKEFRQKKAQTTTNGTKVADASRKAHLIVKLPTEARLYVDNVLVPMKTATRSFFTPTLQPNQNYVYTLRAEIDRNGQKVTQTRRVNFSAGQQVMVQFDNLTPTRTAQR